MASLFLKEVPSLIAALLFALHPIHTEAVTGVVGRAELLSSACFLAAFLSYIRSSTLDGKPSRGPRRTTEWRCFMVFASLVTAAMLCKEQGIVVLGVCAVYEILILQKCAAPKLIPRDRCVTCAHFSSQCQLSDLPLLLSSSKGASSLPHGPSLRILCLGLLGVGLLFLRVFVMGATLPVFTKFDNPAASAPTPIRQLTFNYLLPLNFWLLLFPADLCCDWTMGTVPLISGWADPRNLTSLAFWFVILKTSFIGFRAPTRHRNLIFVALSLLALPFLPASNLFFPVGFVVAERVLYMPSMGFCLLVAHGFRLLWIRCRPMVRKLLLASLLLTFLVHALKTHSRNLDWKDELSIFTSGIRVNQNNAKLYNNVGHSYETMGRYEEALRFFQQAVKVQDDDIGAYINVGRTYNNLKMFPEAEAAYMKAKALLPKAKPGEIYHARIAPSHLSVFLNLATLISQNSTRLPEADLLYRQAIAMRADYTQAYINRGDVLLKMNRTREAQEVYERALFYDSKNADIYYNLGVVFLEQGKTHQALAYFDKALELDPDHAQALMNSAVVIQETGVEELRDLAVQRLTKLLDAGSPSGEDRIYFNLGMLAMDSGNITKAEQWFRLAVEKKEDFRSALFNLALLLSEAHRPFEAVPFLNQLLKFHPDHLKALILLGDVFINHMKDLDAAEKCYERILTLDPNHVQGLHNLCVVYVERGELERAEPCFSRAHLLAPSEGYILKHLEIVRQKIRERKKRPSPVPGQEVASSDSARECFSEDRPDRSCPGNTVPPNGHR
ncbi:unnamed protein product [Cyprideis torosa]|uniref:dolichyl-phosphate-mannose--protein mannosyltransferase n=1 Tax=Cyprideis torosa TaxID=163714 RepID=A0A7R8WJL3_9CRUS|nr:unnamed protein product [Cyprideis torosa]CAG0896108.1 unnamed protein product [Cyprideis torosa]